MWAWFKIGTFLFTLAALLPTRALCSTPLSSAKPTPQVSVAKTEARSAFKHKRRARPHCRVNQPTCSGNVEIVASESHLSPPREVSRNVAAPKIENLVTQVFYKPALRPPNA